MGWSAFPRPDGFALLTMASSTHGSVRPADPLPDLNWESSTSSSGLTRDSRTLGLSENHLNMQFATVKHFTDSTCRPGLILLPYFNTYFIFLKKNILLQYMHLLSLKSIFMLVN